MPDRVLIHAPFADPTQPYVALPTLKAHLRRHGLDARVVDLNVEAAHWLLARPRLEDLAENIGRRFISLNAQQSLTFAEQRLYAALLVARDKIEYVLDADPSPIDVFRQKELFSDPDRYAVARRQIEAYFESLYGVTHPFRIDFNRHSHDVVPWSFDLLDDYTDGETSPLIGFYESVFTSTPDWDEVAAGRPWIDPCDTDFVGISIVFPCQIPEALQLGRFLKERYPRITVVLGGPCLHQIVVAAPDAAIERWRRYADGLAIFEGEESILSLVRRLDVAAQTATPVDLSGIPNLILPGAAGGASSRGPRALPLDLSDQPAPDYGDLDLDRYLAPSRILLYAPTRGCYWNKCSFCYYGLSETATAAYREVPPETVASHLALLSQRHGTKNIYLSCDVLSPKYALRLARALIDRNAKIRWSSDLKIEKVFDREACELLYRSGLRSAAFGIESGSDRILDLMRKGTDRETMTRVNRLFHDAGIACQWMTFTGHPTETAEEAADTVGWIRSESEYVDLFIVGEFGLERGSHIAEDPERYDVDRIWYSDGDDLGLYAQWSQRYTHINQEQREALEASIAGVSEPYALAPYPFAGANSTHHSFLHFLAFGQSAFKTHFQRASAAMKGELPEPRPSHVPGLRERARFSEDRIRARQERFFAEYMPKALYTTVPADRLGGRKEASLLSWPHYEAAIAAEPELRSGNG